MSIGPIDQYGLLPANYSNIPGSIANLGDGSLSNLPTIDPKTFFGGLDWDSLNSQPSNTSDPQGEEDMSSIAKIGDPNAILGTWPGADQLYDLSGADVVVQRRSPLEEALGSSLLRAAKNITDQGLDYSGDARAQIADFTPLQQQAIDEMDKVQLRGPRLDPVTQKPVLDEKGNVIMEPLTGPDGNPIMVNPFVQDQMMARAAGNAYLGAAGNLYGQSGAAFSGEGGPRDQALQSLASIGDVRDKASSVFGQNLANIRSGIGAYQQNLADNLRFDRNDRIADEVKFNTDLVDQEKLIREAGDSSGISSALTSGIRGIEGEGGILNNLSSANEEAARKSRSLALNAGDEAIKAVGEATTGGIGAYKGALEGVGDVQTANQGIADLMRAGIRGGSGVLNTLSAANTAASGKARELAGTAGDNLADRFSTTSSSLADTARNARQFATDAGTAAAGRVNATQTASDLAIQNARQFATDAGTAAAGRVNATQTASDLAIQNARQNVLDATNRLQSAGDFGQNYAEQGIGSLTGTTDRFSPDQISPFMNEFEDAAVQQALADVQRQSDIQAQGIRARAAAAGAFGGSRQAVQESELARNTLEQQGRTAAQMRQAGFESAAQRAQQAFEQQQARAQQAAQLTGALGAQGSQAALQAAQQQGALGLSAEELAARMAQQQGQLGLNADQFAAQTGLSSEELAARIAQQQGQLGLNADQFAAQTGLSAEQMAQAGAMDLGRMGLSSEQIAAQLGMSAEEFAARNAQQQAQTGLSAEDLMARTGMNVQQLAQSGLLSAEQMGLVAYQNQGQQNMAAQQMAAQLGMSAEDFASRIAQQEAQTGLSAEQLMAQMGIDTSKMDLATEQAILNSIQARRKAQMEGYAFDREGYKLENQLGMEGEKLDLQGSQIQAGLYNQDLQDRMNLAKQFEDMATNQAHYTQQAAGGLGSLVSQQGNFANLMQNMQQSSNNYLFNLGTAGQNQRQAEIDAARENALKTMFADRENLTYFSDMLNKVPGQSMKFTSTTQATQPSRGEKLIGLAGQIGAGLMGAKTAGGM